MAGIVLYTFWDSQEANWNYGISMATSSRVEDVTDRDVEGMILHIPRCDRNCCLIAAENNPNIHRTLS